MKAELSLDSICFPSEDIVSLNISGKTIIVPKKAGIVDFEKQICTLSETGWTIWNKLDGEQTLGQIAETLADNFSSPIKEIEKDILEFTAEMLQFGVCTRITRLGLKEEEDKKDTDKKTETEFATDSPYPNRLAEESFSSYIKFGNLSNQEQFELVQGLKELGLSLRTAICGHSMHPFICNKDILVIDPLNVQFLRVGQVVAFGHWQCENLVIHRIVKKKDSGWVIKGDNRIDSDGVVPSENIIGLVKRVQRNGKEVRFCLGPEGILIALLNRGQGLEFLKKLWRIQRRVFRIIYTKSGIYNEKL